MHNTFIYLFFADELMYTIVHTKVHTKVDTKQIKRKKFMEKEKNKFEKLKRVTSTLMAMELNTPLPLPKEQRISIYGTIQRIKKISTMRFKTKSNHDGTFNVTRVR